MPVVGFRSSETGDRNRTAIKRIEWFNMLFLFIIQLNQLDGIDWCRLYTVERTKKRYRERELVTACYHSVKWWSVPKIEYIMWIQYIVIFMTFRIVDLIALRGHIERLLWCFDMFGKWLQLNVKQLNVAISEKQPLSLFYLGDLAILDLLSLYGLLAVLQSSFFFFEESGAVKRVNVRVRTLSYAFL